MGRVISTTNSSAERTRLSKSIVLAMRELMRQPAPDEVSLDLAAYIILALRVIHASIEPSVTAWEKRGYWVKADKFRLEWEWTEKVAQEMSTALHARNWPMIAGLAIMTGERLRHVKVSEKHRLGAPWKGAWKQYMHSK
jgi:hypothetical protein